MNDSSTEPCRLRLILASVLLLSFVYGEAYPQELTIGSSTTSSIKAQRMTQRIKSVALSLHFELPELGLTYRRCLEYAKQLGASHVAIVVQAQMTETTSSTLSTQGGESTSMTELKRVIGLAEELSLKVILFPIIWLDQRGEGEWRGTLAPRDLNRWWISYEEWITTLAVLAEKHKVSMLSIGSELSSLESDEGRWRAMIRRLRSSYSGLMTYSANWDHFDQVGFWDQLDMIGLTAYYPLATPQSILRKRERSSSHSKPRLRVNSMRSRWSLVRLGLIEWLEKHHPQRSIFFTELGYPSQVGGAEKPWHYLQSAEVDLDIQRDAFIAFRETWREDKRLRGVNIWNIWGLGGPHDAWYTIRGKPASKEVARLFEVLSDIPLPYSP